MDEGSAAAAAATREDGAEEKKPNHGDQASEHSVASSSGDRVGVFCCQHCGESFGEEVTYSEHRCQHLQKSLYLDDQLDGLTQTEKDSETTLLCTLCSLSFVEPSEFHSHMENDHGQTSQEESGVPINSGITKQQTYECPDCGKCYFVLGHLLNHQRSHRQASKSVFHDLEHLKKKAFQCESCGRNYSRASALDAHRRCHEEKLVKSRSRGSGDACHTEEPIADGKPIKNQANESPEKLFTCSCGKAFTAMMRLKTHQRFSRNSQCSPEEMKDKPKKGCTSNEFYCSECKKSFSGHIALFNHQRWHANHSEEAVKRYPCEECGKVFMTLTFYYRHKRTAHSEETPAKSFQHQLCQLQKKAFECKDCGLKFSRASALHSHQLHHTDVFKETEKESQAPVSLLPHLKTPESDTTETEQGQVESENVIPTVVTEELDADDTDEEMESYEPGDFNVQVISASESEDEPLQDQNPDLELLCESDQEAREDDDIISPMSTVSKSQMDLKIVQIDFEPCAPVAMEAESKTAEQRFDCPDCYRWFSSAASLRVHRMWHGVRKRRQQTQVALSHACQECGLKFTNLEVFNTHLHQHALEEEGDEDEEEDENNDNKEVEDDDDEVEGDDDEEEEENGDIDTGDDAFSCGTSSSSPTNPSVDAAPLSLPKKNLQSSYSCRVCGKVYKYLASLTKHVSRIHEKQFIKKNVYTLNRYECPICGMSCVRKARLRSHMAIHRPLKSSLPRCEQCHKRFDSKRSWYFHVKSHKKRPFRCLSCAKGFTDEEALEKHLQSHSQKLHDCHICHKTFPLLTQLTQHYRTHTGEKPSPGSLISAGCPPVSVIEESEMDTDVEEQPGKEGHAEESEAHEDAEFEDGASSKESDYEAHHFKPRSAKSNGPRLKSGPGEEAKHESDSEETEWDCLDCDMGFDDVEKLHMHYIKHARGELPMRRDNIES